MRDHWEASHPADGDAVLCGDFNICPAPIDSWNEDPARIFHSAEERQRFQSILDTGLTDLFRDRYPDIQKYSWWDYRMGAFHRNMGLRIDFLLATPSVAGKLQSVETDRDYRKKKDGMTASDHAPVIAEF